MTKIRFFFFSHGSDDCRTFHLHPETRAESSQALLHVSVPFRGLARNTGDSLEESLNLIVPLGLFREHLLDLNEDRNFSLLNLRHKSSGDFALSLCF